MDQRISAFTCAQVPPAEAVAPYVSFNEDGGALAISTRDAFGTATTVKLPLDEAFRVIRDLVGWSAKRSGNRMPAGSRLPSGG